MIRYSTPSALILLLACCAAAMPGALAAQEAPPRTMANVPLELALTASLAHDDPFNTVTLDVIVTSPSGASCRVPAFWDGGASWKVRYASPEVGLHHWQSVCSAVADGGLHGQHGDLEVIAYHGDNPLFRHGPIRIAADARHFEHRDGTPFFWLGDTWWMGLCSRLHWPDEFAELAADRSAKGFTVIQIVAGLYPDMPPFDVRGANEAGFPWEKDYARMRPEYFDAADKRLDFLVLHGLSPCIVGSWGYFLPWLCVDRAKQHWRYLIARYGAYPVIWCAAGEANLPWYLAKGFPYDDREVVHGWTEVARSLRACDPFHRLVTIHPTGIGPLNARHAIDDPALIDFDMLQTPHGERDADRTDLHRGHPFLDQHAGDADPRRRGQLRDADGPDPPGMAARDVLAVHGQWRRRPYLRGERDMAVQPQGAAAREIAARRHLWHHLMGRCDAAAGFRPDRAGEGLHRQPALDAARAAAGHGPLGRSPTLGRLDLVQRGRPQP